VHIGAGGSGFVDLTGKEGCCSLHLYLPRTTPLQGSRLKEVHFQ
jgi:hypothetical protein